MTIVYFILVLGVTIFIHELGHFIFAKKAGVHIYEFSLGMGPTIYKHVGKDKVDYCLRLFPIGGFVSMAGEDEYTDKKIPKDKQLIFKPWKDRFLTIIAGVLFNFLLAIILLFIVALINGVPKYTAKVDSIEPGYPLEETNIKANDTILKINGKNIHSTDQLTILLATSKGETTFKVKHQDNKVEEIKASPIKVEENKETTYKFGLVINNEKTHNFLKILIYPFIKIFSLLEQMILIIKFLILGKLSLNNLSGPVGIYTVVDASAKAGFLNIIYLTAYLCVNVGFMNIIPLPAFDGGRAFFMIIEKIRGKAIDSKIENMIHTIGFYLLMALMVLITYNDILRIIK